MNLIGEASFGIHWCASYLAALPPSFACSCTAWSWETKLWLAKTGTIGWVMELPAGDMQLIWYNIYIYYIYIPTTWGLLKHSVHGLGLQVPQSLTMPMTKATRVEFRQNDWEGHLIKIGSVDEPFNFRILYGILWMYIQFWPIPSNIQMIQKMLRALL